ncbi:MAG: hypothetical protein ACPMAG_02180 [Limisphaerales bacterium]
MGEETEIKFEGDYVHIIHPKGYEINLESLEELYSELAELCKKHKCFKILAECDSPTRKLQIHQAFTSANHLSSKLPLIKLTCCFYNHNVDDVSEFFKTVAYNRGLRVEFFQSKEKALEWLRS